MDKIERSKEDAALLVKYRKVENKRGPVVLVAKETGLNPRTVERAVKRAIAREQEESKKEKEAGILTTGPAPDAIRNDDAPAPFQGSDVHESTGVEASQGE